MSMKTGYCSFEVGQHVLCINAISGAFRPNYPGIEWDPGLDGLTEGVVYTVRMVAILPFPYDSPSVFLEEIIRPNCDPEVGFDYRRFKPLQHLTVKNFMPAEIRA